MLQNLADCSDLLSERRQALIELLSLPDSPDLRRGHRLTIEGRADRHQILPRLAAAFVQQYLMDRDERNEMPPSPTPDEANATWRLAADEEVGTLGRLIRWPTNWLQLTH